jgi:hypothetical protein
VPSNGAGKGQFIWHWQSSVIRAATYPAGHGAQLLSVVGVAAIDARGVLPPMVVLPHTRVVTALQFSVERMANVPPSQSAHTLSSVGVLMVARAIDPLLVVFPHVSAVTDKQCSVLKAANVTPVLQSAHDASAVVVPDVKRLTPDDTVVLPHARAVSVVHMVQFSLPSTAQNPTEQGVHVPAVVRLASPTARVPPAANVPQTVFGKQFELSVAAAQKLVVQDVHVLSAVAMGALTWVRLVVPPSVVPVHSVTAVQFAAPLMPNVNPETQGIQEESTVVDPTAYREVVPVVSVLPHPRATSVVQAAQFELSPTAAKKLVAHAVQVRSAVVVGALTSTRLVVPPSVVPEHAVTAAQFELSPTAAKKLVVHAVQVRSAVVVGALT